MLPVRVTAAAVAVVAAEGGTAAGAAVTACTVVVVVVMGATIEALDSGWADGGTVGVDEPLGDDAAVDLQQCHPEPTTTTEPLLARRRVPKQVCDVALLLGGGGAAREQQVRFEWQEALLGDRINDPLRLHNFVIATHENAHIEVSVTTPPYSIGREQRIQRAIWTHTQHPTFLHHPTTSDRRLSTHLLSSWILESVRLVAMM